MAFESDKISSKYIICSKVGCEQNILIHTYSIIQKLSGLQYANQFLACSGLSSQFNHSPTSICPSLPAILQFISNNAMASWLFGVLAKFMSCSPDLFCIFFVPRGIRDGQVSCLSVPSFFKFRDLITYKRFELASSNLVWWFIMMIRFAYCSRIKIRPPNPLKPP